MYVYMYFYLYIYVCMSALPAAGCANYTPGGLDDLWIMLPGCRIPKHCPKDYPQLQALWARVCVWSGKCDI